jgi:hypothetical protein
MARKPHKPSAAGPVKRGRGRPSGTSTYDAALVDQILAGVARGDSLRKVCKSLGIDDRTVRTWISGNIDGLAARFTTACELRAELYASEIVEIADDAKADANAIALARLKIDARKWTSCKLLPKRYGEHLSAALTGPDGGAIRFEAMLGPLGDLPPDELAIVERILRRRVGAVSKGADDADV